MSTSISIDVPDALVASYSKHSGASGRAWIAALPGLAAGLLDQWALRLDGPAGYGMASLVLPVVRADGTPGALKLQAVSVVLRRVLQNALWDIADGQTALDPAQIAIATALLHRPALTGNPSNRR